MGSAELRAPAAWLGAWEFGVADVAKAVQCSTWLELKERWPALCATMGREHLLEDERYSTNGRRVRNKESLEAEITAWTRSHRKHELALMAKAAGFPGAAVRSMDEVVHDEHLHERGFLEWVDHPDDRLDSKFGMKVAAHPSPLRFWGSDTPPVRLSPACGSP